MSRVGQNPVNIPRRRRSVDRRRRTDGERQTWHTDVPLMPVVEVAVEDGQVIVKPVNDGKRARTMWGTTRSLVNNAVLGVSEGFTKKLKSTALATVRKFKVRRSIFSSVSATTFHMRSRKGLRSRSRAIAAMLLRSAVQINKSSVRLRVKFAPSVNLNPTRARVLSMSTSRSSARKARRSKGFGRC